MSGYLCCIIALEHCMVRWWLKVGSDPAWLQRAVQSSTDLARPGQCTVCNQNRSSVPVAPKQMRMKSKTSAEMGDAPLLSSRTSPAGARGKSRRTALDGQQGQKQQRALKAVRTEAWRMLLLAVARTASSGTMLLQIQQQLVPHPHQTAATAAHLPPQPSSRNRGWTS